MKIVFTGGGSGGHFYPIIAVAEAVREVAKERKIIQPELFYMAPSKSASACPWAQAQPNPAL